MKFIKMILTVEGEGGDLVAIGKNIEPKDFWTVAGHLQEEACRTVFVKEHSTPEVKETFLPMSRSQTFKVSFLGYFEIPSLKDQIFSYEIMMANGIYDYSIPASLWEVANSIIYAIETQGSLKIESATSTGKVELTDFTNN